MNKAIDRKLNKVIVIYKAQLKQALERFFQSIKLQKQQFIA